MRKKIIFIMLGLLVLLVTGCGKNKQIKTDLKLTKAVRTDIKLLKDEQNEFAVVSIFAGQKIKKKILKVKEYDINQSYFYEDELVKINFKFKEGSMLSNVTNKSKYNFIIDWNKGYFKKNNNNKQKLVRTNVDWLSLRTDQEKETIVKNKTKIITYTAFENIGYDMGSGALSMTYWTKGKLLQNVDFFEIQIPFYSKDKIYNYIFKFSL